MAKLDRLSRSMLDFAGLMGRATKEGWALVALDLGVDTTTPAGEAMANVMVSFGQLERRLIGQRTREALLVKKAAGVRLGRPVSISADVAAMVGQLYASGATLQAIADRLADDGIPTAQGGRRWYASTVQQLVKRLGHANRSSTIEN